MNSCVGPGRKDRSARSPGRGRHCQLRWSSVRTTHGLERLHGEIKRRIRAVGAFPDRASALHLITAVALQDHRGLGQPPLPGLVTPRGHGGRQSSLAEVSRSSLRRFYTQISTLPARPSVRLRLQPSLGGGATDVDVGDGPDGPEQPKVRESQAAATNRPGRWRGEAGTYGSCRIRHPPLTNA